MKGRLLPIAVILVTAVLIPLVITNNYYLHLFNNSMVYLIAVYGLNFITGLAGQTNLGMAGILCLGAYTSGILTVKLGTSAWLGLICAMLMGLLAGVVLGYPSLRVKGIFLALTTVGFTETIRIVMNNWVSLTGGALGLKDIPNFFLFGLEIRDPVHFYYLMLVMSIFFSIIAYRVIHSKWGRAFIAVRDNVEAVELCGINLAKLQITAFTLAAVFGSAAGAFYAHSQNYIHPVSFTVDMSILIVVMMIVGGAGNMYGCIIGSIVITFLPEFLRGLGDYYQLAYAATAMFFVVFVPGGVVSIFKRIKVNRAMKNTMKERMKW